MRACVLLAGIFAGDGPPIPVLVRWNGRSWRASQQPAYPGRLVTPEGLSCVSTTVCTLVGTISAPQMTPPFLSRGTAYAARFVRLSWSQPQPVADPTVGSTGSYALTGVSCTAARCMAVGYAMTAGGSQQTLAEQYR
jgi:hypothetical protein